MIASKRRAIKKDPVRSLVYPTITGKIKEPKFPSEEIIAAALATYGDNFG